MGIVLIVCAGVGLISRSVHGARDSHIADPATPVGGPGGLPLPAVDPGDVGAGAAGLPAWVNILSLLLAILAPLVLFLLWRLDVIRPGSLRRRGMREVSAWPWWFWLLCAFSVWLSLAIGAGMAQALLGAMMTDPPRALETAVLSVGGATAALVATAVLVHIVQEEVHDPRAAGVAMRFGWRDIRSALVALALTLPLIQAASVLSLFIYRATTGQDPEIIAHEMLIVLHREPGSLASWLLIAGAVVGAPIVEEFIFRVFLQSSLVRLFRRAWPAVLAASAIFALIHVGAGVNPQNWHTLPVLFVLGAAMGIAYEWTRRPIVPIIMHMTFNGYNVVLVIFAIG